MPGNLLTADTSFPNLTGEQSTDEKFGIITNYLYMLLEQLRYTLANLGMGNFNDTELESLINLITEPVYVQLKDEQGHIAALQITAESLTSRLSDAEGHISVLQQTAESLSSRISDTEGNVTVLQQTSQSLSTRVSDAEGNISTLQQTSAGLITRVTDAEGNISTLQQTASGLSVQISNTQGSVSALQQTVNSITLSVSNYGTASTISLMRNGIAVSSQNITFTGMVTFNDLAGSGMTTINGDNIITGTITGTTLVSREYSDVPSWVAGRRTVAIQEGRITFGYYTGSGSPALVGTVYGQIYTDYANNRFYVGTPGGVVLKLYSGGNMSIDAASGYNVYIGTQDGTSQNVHIGRGTGAVYLNGTVYVNGSIIS